jgi:hypothetical protein
MRLVVVLGLFSVVGGALIVSCSATSEGSDFDDESGPGSGNPSGNGGAGAGAGVGGGLNPSGGSGPEPGAQCSADLQNVVDENGAVIQQCPPEQGCYGGQCIPACDAAAQSKGTIGCDFYAPDPPFYANGQIGATQSGPCFAVFLANTWSRPAKLTVSRGAQTFDVTQFGRIPKGIGASVTYEPLPATGLPPNEVAVLFLSHRPGVNNGTSLECPVPPAVLEDAAVHGSGTGVAFHVASDTPVSSYDILPYGGALSYLPSATLLFPSTAWGTNYIGVAPHPESGGTLWVTVVGAEDNTKLQIAPLQALPGGGTVPMAPAGETTEVTIGKGEIVQWAGGDPTSAVLQSDKPVGVWTGNTYLRVTSATSPGGGGQDSAHQQIAHIKALGSEYVGGNVVSRFGPNTSESTPYRMVGVVDGTELAYDPPIPGAPPQLAAGQVVEFETTEAFTVRSQDVDHPFAMTQYMAGYCTLGDEEWVHLLSPQQFLQRYVFFTDPTYATTNLVVLRKKGEAGFADVEIECLGAPISGWKAVGTEGLYEYAHVGLVSGGVPVAGCGVSRHEAKSTGQFGIVVWGTDSCSSYGYPAGGNVGSINEVVVPPPDPK